jgi:murein DD-endopeptidase MepM/ murein hydrolase activator NlpD
VRDASALRGSRLTKAPAVPTFLGLALVAVAGAGAVTVDQQPSSGAVVLSSRGSQSMNGTDAVGYTGSRRELALSRDSERQALQDKANQRLQAATEQQAQERNAALKSLGRAAEKHALQIAQNQWHLPTVGYHLTARFGMAGGLWSSNHTGLDFAAPDGTPIFAVANGKITETGWAGAYGNRTIETLEDGTELWYCHQSAINVNVGDTVSGGQTIGAVGSTGNVTGPHVHLEVRPGGGDPVDPYQALVVHGVRP